MRTLLFNILTPLVVATVLVTGSSLGALESDTSTVGPGSSFFACPGWPWCHAPINNAPVEDS